MNPGLAGLQGFFAGLLCGLFFGYELHRLHCRHKSFQRRRTLENRFRSDADFLSRHPSPDPRQVGLSYDDIRQAIEALRK